MDKNINSMCCCGIALNYKKGEDVIMMYPCEHLIHKNCYENNSKKLENCPKCNNKIKSIIKADDYKTNPKLYQQCVDILAMTNTDDYVDVNYDRALLNIPRLLLLSMRIPFTKGYDNGRALCGDILRMANIKIKIKGLDRIKPEPKIFVINHSSYLDFFLVYYVLKAGFLSTSTLIKNPFTRPIANIIPILIIEINKKGGSDTVNRMKDFVEKYGSLCIFPEGMITHPKTLAKFRTGAFMVGVPVYPIILNFQNRVSDLGISDMMLKMSSGHSEVVNMEILEPFYPPFNDEKIELVRKTMADAGNFHLSRISNKDIDNIKNKNYYRK